VEDLAGRRLSYSVAERAERYVIVTKSREFSGNRDSSLPASSLLLRICDLEQELLLITQRSITQ
jgi:hypothetical protein